MKREQHEAGGEPAEPAPMRVAVLVPPEPADGRPDQEDTFVQAEQVSECVRSLGHRVFRAEYADHGPRTSANLARIRPDVVINLVEEVPEGPHYLHLTTALLDRLGLRYTGARTAALQALGDKRIMKVRLREAGLPVAPDLDEADPDGRFIVKSAIEHASFGIDDTSLVDGRDAAERLIAERERTYGGIWFAEGYIHGREFDVSMVEESEGLRLLPVSELDFYGPSLTGPRVFDYDTKWHPECAIAKGIEREFPEREEPLFSELERLAIDAWNCFGLTGFAHADFRVDEEGRPFILEINANPCLGEEAGICRAAMEVGLSQVDIVAALLSTA